MSGVTGDNPYRASGVVAAAGGAGGISWQAVETGSTMTAVAGNGYPINTTSNACTVTLPAGTVGNIIEFVDYAGTWDTNNVTLTADGSEKIKGATDDVTLLTERQGTRIAYVDATQGWVAVSGINQPGTTAALFAPPYEIAYLVIAGGGSGGHGGYDTSGANESAGGGAGGYRNSYASESSGGGASVETPWTIASTGVTLTVTVGDGGAARAASAGNIRGNDGSASSIAMTGQTTVSTVGGGGGGAPNVSVLSGNDGGCGGGSGSGQGTTTDPGAGTADQGFAGGNGGSSYFDNDQGSGGGGGVGAVGGNSAGTTTGTGGVGLSSSITGSAVFRGGGGGGSASNTSYTEGAGGNGGGGAGNDGDEDAVSGTANTGAGGGGNSNNGYASGAGGKGVVFLRMPTSYYSTTNTNAETPIVDGIYTILQFNTDGTYTT